MQSEEGFDGRGGSIFQIGIVHASLIFSINSFSPITLSEHLITARGRVAARRAPRESDDVYT